MEPSGGRDLPVEFGAEVEVAMGEIERVSPEFG
jgi:hypothetical protein